MGNPEPDEKDGVDAKGSSVIRRSWPDCVVNYLNLVMKTFEHQPKTYREFFRYLADYKCYRTSADCLIVKVHFLFNEHKELLKGFNQFVPWRYKGSNDFIFDDAIEFTRKIKLCFSHDTNVPEYFLLLLCNYKNGTSDLEETFIKVSKLFEGHPVLLMEYQKYLPPVISEQSQPVAIPVPLPADDSLEKYTLKVKKAFPDQPEKIESILNIIKDIENQRIDNCMIRAKVWDLFKDNPGLIIGINEFLPEDCRMKILFGGHDRGLCIITTIMCRLQYDPSKIGPFEMIRKRYFLDMITFDDLYTEVMENLKNHPALLNELRIPILVAYLSMSPMKRHLSRKDLFEIGLYVW